MHLGALHPRKIRIVFPLILGLAAIVCTATEAAADGGSIHIQPSATRSEVQPITIAKAQADPPVEPLATEPVPAPAATAELHILALDEAQALVLGNSPLLDAFDLEYSAMDALAWQAGRRPNPELELEFSDFGGSVDATGVRALGTSLTYTQLIERGNKREKRENAASFERELVSWDRLEFEHEILGMLRRAYTEALIAQYELERIEDYHELAERIYEVVAARVEAGRAAGLELAKLDIEMGAIELERDQARRAVNQAYLALATTWGAESVTFDAVAGDLLDLPAPGDRAALEQALANHPALARWDDEYQALCTALDLEFAVGVPDISMFGGIGYANKNEETVFNVGVAIDLPIHDRNEGAISAAGSRLEQVEFQRRAAELRLTAELTGLHAEASAALEAYRSYEMSLMPAAREHYELTNLGYTYGKFGLLEVLDAERTMIDLQNEQAGALVEYHRALTGIEALLGTSIDQVELTPDEIAEENNV